MNRYRVNLQGGRSYIITANSAAEASRLANQDAEDSGATVLSVTAEQSLNPVETVLPDGTRVAFSAPAVPTAPSPTAFTTGSEGDNRFVSIVPPAFSDPDENEEIIKQQEEISKNLQDINEQVASAVNTGFLPSQPVNPTLPQLSLAEVDPQAAFVRQLGLTSRPLTDPFRRSLINQSFDFFNPFRFGNVLRGGQFFSDQDRSAPGFDDYLAVVQNPLQARQSAANIFDQIVSGVRDNSFTPGTTASILGDVLGARARTTPFGLAQGTDNEILQGFAQLGRQALQNRVGSAAFNLIESQLPSVQDLYTDYFTRSRAGEDVAPTFAETLQSAFGLGGR
tara:strand:- start:613 stop:1623 length:1011 start_codon:yes stop_codon:yes gene_type:complete